MCTLAVQWRRTVLALLGVAVGSLTMNARVVKSSLTFTSSSPGSPLAGLTLYTTPMSSFVGPQPGDSNNTRTGPVVLFTGDICQPTSALAPGSIILVPTNGVTGAQCSYETQYLNLFGTGAAAIILPIIDELPSVDMYTNDGSRGAQTRQLPMLFLMLGPSDDVYTTLITMAPGQNATVSPDANVWQNTFASWYYQLFMRILPSAILIVSGVAALVYFVSHIRLMDADYSITVPKASRSLARRATFIRKALSLPHAVLATEVVTSTLSGVVLSIGGYMSTPNLPYPVVAYFVTLLSGWSLASSVMSSSVWIRHLSLICEQEALLSRILRGDYPAVFVLLLAIPVAIDTAFSVLCSTYGNGPVLVIAASSSIFLLQLVVGLHVLFGVMNYYWIVRNIQRRTVSGATRWTTTGMDAFLARLARCALGMSLSMILVCIGSALAALASESLYNPPRWTFCFALTINGRALDSAFRVAMFKPRSNSVEPEGAQVTIVAAR